jgi:hypothetical protein
LERKKKGMEEEEEEGEEDVREVSVCNQSRKCASKYLKQNRISLGLRRNIVSRVRR